VWSGGDGRGKINTYDLAIRNYYQGWLEGNHWARGFSYPPGWYDYCPANDRPLFACFEFPVAPAGVTGGAELPAIDNLISNILGHSFQLNLTLAEAPETLKYILGKVRTLVRSFKYLKKGDILRAFNAVGLTRINGKRIKVLKNPFKAPREYWLEYRYAIMPLVGDVNSAMEYLDSKTGKPQSAKVRGGSRYKPSLSMASNYMGNPIYWPNRKAMEYASAGVTLVEDFDYESVDWSNPFTAAWELTPFSFIVDWSLKIGDYLRARWFFHFSSYSMGYITSFLKYSSGNYSGDFYVSSQNLCKFSGPMSSSYDERIYVRRRQLTGTTIPLPVVLNPLTEDGHWKRIVDSVALLAGYSSSNSRKWR
jgi:hypothetical protein